MLLQSLPNILIKAGKKWYQKWDEFPLIENSIEWSKEFKLGVFGGVPLYYIIKFIIAEFKNESIVMRANSIAFSFFLSIFPLVIFTLPILTSMPFAENYFENLEASLNGVIPDNAIHYIFSIIEGIQTEGHFGLLSISFVFSVIFASNGMNTLMNGFNKSYDVSFKERGFFRKRIIAIFLTVLVSFLGVVSVFVIILGNRIINWSVNAMHISAGTGFVIASFRWLVVIMLFYTLIALIYRFGPTLKKKTKYWNPGAAFATFLSILLSIVFSYYVNNFGSYNEVYGSIGALIVMLIWLQLNAFILLVGFELNAAIVVNKDLQEELDAN